jgi:hypothetical protein
MASRVSKLSARDQVLTVGIPPSIELSLYRNRKRSEADTVEIFMRQGNH